jgi:DNA transformation protein and related proteins
VPGKQSLSELPNLGPKSSAMLLAAGVHSLAKLRKLGAVAAYLKVKKVRSDASLNLLWALEGALTDTHWRVVAKESRTSLLIQLDDLSRRGARK